MMATWADKKELMSATQINGSWQKPQTIGYGASQSVAIGGDDVATAVWLQQVSVNQRQVAASRYIGGIWGNPKILSSPSDSEFTRPPRVAANIKGEVIAIWISDNGKQSVAQSSRFTSGQWTQPVTLSNESSEATSTDIVLDDEGDATAVWSESRPSGSFIFARRGSSSKQLYPLVVTKEGLGTVTSSPTGIDCPQTCSMEFEESSQISLAANPDDGYAFSGWEGAYSSRESCIVTMDGEKAVIAKFIELTKYPVSVIRSNFGVISSEPADILCGGPNRQCIASFSSAKLTATPNAGYEFIKWVGCPSGQGSECTINPTSKMTIQAVFKKLPKYTLKVTKDKLGSVSSSPAGLKCPASKKTCSVKFDKGTEVTLTPTPQPGRTFAGWTGACSGFDPCVIQTDGNKGVGATFQ